MEKESFVDVDAIDGLFKSYFPLPFRVVSAITIGMFGAVCFFWITVTSQLQNVLY